VKSSGLWQIIKIANPYFVLAAVLVPIVALIFAMNRVSITSINFVHIMAGALWTGIDLFLGLILGPTLGGVTPGERANVFKRLTPKMTFFMPVIAAVTVTAGINVTQRLGMPLDSLKIVISLIISGVLTVQGFGFLLPNEIRILRELLSDKPDVERIGKLGMTNAKLGGVQGVLQVSIILVMALIRF